jgi:methionyl aminopeptidase
MDYAGKSRQRLTVKTAPEMQRIRKASRILERLFRELGPLIVPGVTPAQLSAYCERFIVSCRAVPALKGYRGYPAAICASPNNVAVHGIPTNTPLACGDIITLDITVNLDGWHSDSAWTYAVGKPSAEKALLLRAAWRASLAGILAAKAGGRIGDIGAAIERTAKRFGLGVLEDFAGHGIGRILHEDPIVMNTGIRGTGQPIVPGMVFTVEPILCLGKPELLTLDDGWTVVTKDGSPTAQFEHTIAIFHERTEIMTFSSPDIRFNLDVPPCLL